MIFRKKILYAVIYVVYLLACIAAGDYIFYRSFLAEISCKSSGRVLSPLEKMVGADIKSTKKSSFLNFHFTKAPEVIRVGCFGDSFVFGDEVSGSYSYPDFLQKLFDDDGCNVEVLNFGHSGGSLGLSFIAWQEYNKKYDLDYVVFGPSSIWPDRDLSFCGFIYDAYRYDWYKRICYGLPADKGQYQWLAEYLHGKIILENGKLVLVEPYGDTTDERYKAYTRWITPWRYLRYDSNPPLFIMAPLLKLSPSLTFDKNLFYYNRDFSEIKKIYDIIFTRMSHESREFVFLPKLFPLWCFPYVAPYNHSSPQGNYFISRQYFDFLTGKSGSVQKILTIEDISGMGVSPAKALDDYTDIAFELGGQDIGYFYTIVDTFKRNYDEEKRHALDCKAVLMLYSGDSVMDGIFVPLDFLPVNGELLKLQIQLGFKMIELPAGKINAYGHASVFKAGSLADFLEIEDPKTSKMLFADRILAFFCKASGYKKARSIKFILGNRVIMISKARMGDSFLMVPRKGYLMRIRASGARFVNIDRLPDTGDIFIKLYKKNGSFEKYLFARYYKQEVRVEFNASIKKPITKKAGQ